MKKIFKLSGHHLNPPGQINPDEVKGHDLVKIVGDYDTFCDTKCKRGCDYTTTELGENIRDLDKTTAEHYGFEVGGVYTIEEFLDKISKITKERKEDSRSVTKYCGLPP